MRLFIALELPLQVKDSLEKWRKQVSGEYPALKWIKCENLHVTLRFLGHVDPNSTIDCMRSLKLDRFLPVTFQLNRLGTFGRPPSVLWVGGSFSTRLAEAALLLNDIQDENGLFLQKPFVPHVTVARASGGGSVPELSFTGSIAGKSTLISLVSSTLTPWGPIYRTLFSAGS